MPDSTGVASRGIRRRSRKRAAAAAFYAITVGLSPLTGLGYLCWAGSLVVHRGSGVSATAQGPLSTRWVQHRLGVRPDPAADRLMSVLPGVPPLAPRLVAAPLLLAHRLTEHVPRPLRHPFDAPVLPPYEVLARTTFLDAVVEQRLPGLAQLVVLGAGFDTRAWRPGTGAVVPVFEVDAPATQAAKRRMVAEAGLATDRVRFVAVDFETQSWVDRLVATGFDPRRPTLFLWEGVTMYLSARAVEATLRAIAGTAPGSVVAFDYLTDVPLASPRLFWRAVRAAPRAGGEPFTFGIDSSPPLRERVGELLRSCGLVLGDHRTLGEESDGKRAWGGFATAVVPVTSVLREPNEDRAGGSFGTSPPGPRSGLKFG